MESNSEKEATIELIFRQYIFNSVLMIADAVDQTFLIKENAAATNIIDIMDMLYDKLKEPYDSWFEGMRESNFEEVAASFKKIAQSNIDSIREEKGEVLNTIFSIINYVIENDLHHLILKSYNLNQDCNFNIDFENYKISVESCGSIEQENVAAGETLESSDGIQTKDVPTLTADEVIRELPLPQTFHIDSLPEETVIENIIESPSSSDETVIQSPEKTIDETSVEPCRKRKLSIEEDFPPQKRIKKFLCVKAFLGFQFDRNPLIGVKKYSFATFSQYVINEPCKGDWEEKLRRQLKDAGVTNLYVQGRSQARYLKGYIPDIYITPLPQRNREKVCEDCKNFGCSVGKIKNYMKDFHNFVLPITCL